MDLEDRGVVVELTAEERHHLERGNLGLEPIDLRRDLLERRRIALGDRHLP
jgi:hypothetical protein